ncbi:MAG: MTAP family purine nucleoside phosphorylase [Thermoplasmata archaeon]|nr:MTAP family purine nucleoside phosphorylase [Thermoplasmata archaeon]
MTEVELGILAGTGFYDLDILDTWKNVELDTPYGKPSAPYKIGRYNGRGIAFLPRHGKEHTIPPHKVNFKANIWGLRELGASNVMGINSMGSLKEEIVPPCIVIPDDYVGFFDIPTFYDEEVKHASPDLSEELRDTLLEAARTRGIEVRDGGVAVQTTGPRFETRAEIKILSNWGDLVGMNMASEATLCSELGMSYSNIASVDNYGNGICGERPTFELVLANSKKNHDRVEELVKGAIELLLG